jgi:hypothetical protein
MKCITAPSGTCDCHSARLIPTRNGKFRAVRDPLPKPKPSQKCDQIRREILQDQKHTNLGGEKGE